MNGRFLRSPRQPTGTLKQVQLTVNVLKTITNIVVSPAVNLKEQFTRKNEVIRLSIRQVRQN